MAGLSFPTELTAANWDKQKGVDDKPTGIGDALKKLHKLNDAIDLKLLDSGRLKASDEYEERIDDLQTELNGKVKACVAQLKAVETLGTKWANEYKKDKNAARTVPAACLKVSDAAGDYGTDLAKAFETEIADLKKQLPKIVAAEEKDEEDDKAEGGFRKVATPRVISAMRQVKRDQKDAKAVQFMIVEGNKHAVAYMGVSVSPGHRKKLIEILKERGDTTFKSFRGECIWEAKSYTFVGLTVPTGAGLAKKLKEGLDDLTGIKYKVRLRKPDGEAEEAGGEVDEDEDAALAKAEGRTGGSGGSNDQPSTLDPLKAITARVQALMPRVQALTASDPKAAAKVVDLISRASLEAKAKGGFERASALIDEVEKALANVKAPAPGSTASTGGGGDGGATATPGGEPKGLSIVKLGKARVEWANIRTQAIRDINRVAQRLVEEFRNEADQQAQLKKAVTTLRDLSAKLKDDLEDQLDAALNESDPAKRQALAKTAKATLMSLVKLVTEDPVLADLDHNEITPDLVIVAPMKARLRDIALALG